MKIKKKNFFYIILILLLIFGSINSKNIINKLRKNIINKLPKNINYSIKVLINYNNILNNLDNDYNKVFLPETQFAKINFEKIKLNFLNEDLGGYYKVSDRKTFFIEIFRDYLIVISVDGNFYYKKINEIKDSSKAFIKIESKSKENFVLDTFISNNEIFISYISEVGECKYLNLAKSELNFNELNFVKIFSIENECAKFNIQSGKINEISINNTQYILLSTAADILGRKDEKDLKPQSEESLYGKILLIDKDNYTYEIYSKGHRNILGLIVAKNNNILSTENGPKGGDEINLIKKNRNYGWDITSYGKKYSSKDNEPGYSNLIDLDFEEPIFSFIPSIGISEIVELDNNFDNDWKNNFLISSLNYKHLLRVKINLEKEKLDYIEEIYIGERIRDIKYFEKDSMILMALENTGSIGLILKENSK